MEQATVVYDFDGMIENGEINLTAGEIVTVHRKDVGDGWWEGTKNDGKSGLFPAAYVTIIQNENNLQPVSVCEFLQILILGFKQSFNHNSGLMYFTNCFK